MQTKKPTVITNFFENSHLNHLKDQNQLIFPQQTESKKSHPIWFIQLSSFTTTFHFQLFFYFTFLPYTERNQVSPLFFSLFCYDNLCHSDFSTWDRKKKSSSCSNYYFNRPEFLRRKKSEKSNNILINNKTNLIKEKWEKS